MTKVSTDVLLLGPHVGVPVPLERIDIESIPTHLSGIDGRNRERYQACQLDANTDLAAIQEWLEESGKSSKETYRSYRRECERFYAWLMLVKMKPLSSFTRSEVLEYFQFLQDPQPKATWCAKRNISRSAPEWRPFEKGLSDRSRKQAMVILASLFSYLEGNGYLSGNPMNRWSKKTKSEEKSDQVARRQKHLDINDITVLFTVLEEAASNCPVKNGKDRLQQARFERWLFIARFLTNTGLRREELAAAVVGDIYQSTHALTRQTEWFMKVVGKGSKLRIIALPPNALAAYERYVKYRGHAASTLGSKCPILLSESGNADEHQSGQSIYSNNRKALKFVAAKIESTHPQSAQKMLRASPHWYRSTFATLASQFGVPTEDIQHQLGHDSLETTGIYTGIDDFVHAASMKKVAI